MARFTSHSRERVGQKNKARGGKNTVTITNRGKIPRKKKNSFVALLDSSPQLWEYVDQDFWDKVNKKQNDFGRSLNDTELLSIILEKSAQKEQEKRQQKQMLKDKILNQLGIDLNDFRTARQMPMTRKMSPLEERERTIQFDYIAGRVDGYEGLTMNEKASLTTYYSEQYEFMKGYILSVMYDREQYNSIPYYHRYIESYERLLNSKRVSERMEYIEKMKQDIKFLNDALAKAPPLSTSTRLFHGGKLEAENIGEIGEFILPTSTTYQSDVGSSFANDPSRYLVIIHAPKGVRGLLGSTKGLAGFKNEHEVTFPIGQKYIVLDVEKNIHDEIQKVEILLLPDGIDSIDL